MFIIQWIRFLFGTVRFRVRGSFPERFLNLIAQNEISLWAISRQEGDVYASIMASKYKRLRPIARKSKMQVRLVEKKGLPFVLRKYRRRKGLLIGAAVFLGILFGLSQFVWNIEIEGNTVTSTQQILSALSELGVRSGMWKGNVHPAVLEQELTLYVPSLAQVAVRFQGSDIVLEVREKVDRPFIVPEDEPCNLVAARDGEILFTRPVDGQSFVSKGYAVKAGDLLISGIVEDALGNTSFTHARGVVQAKTQRELRVEVPFVEQQRQKTGKTSVRRTLQLFMFRIPLSWEKGMTGDYETHQEEHQLLNLPIRYTRQVWEEVTYVPVTLTPEQAREKALRLIEEKKTREFTGVTITGQEIEEQTDGEKLTLTARYQCEENIAVEQKLLIDNQPAPESEPLESAAQ